MVFRVLNHAGHKFDHFYNSRWTPTTIVRAYKKTKYTNNYNFEVIISNVLKYYSSVDMVLRVLNRLKMEISLQHLYLKLFISINDMTIIMHTPQPKFENGGHLEFTMEHISIPRDLFC